MLAEKEIQQKFKNVCVEIILRKQSKMENPKMETWKVNGYVACSSLGKKPSYNSGYKKWQIMLQIHVYLSQEFLSLTENNQFRSLPLLVAAERYKIVAQTWFSLDF